MSLRGRVGTQARKPLLLPIAQLVSCWAAAGRRAGSASSVGPPLPGWACPLCSLFPCHPLQAATPKFDLRAQPGETYIMLVDRGPNTPGTTACKFAEKVGAERLAARHMQLGCA